MDQERLIWLFGSEAHDILDAYDLGDEGEVMQLVEDFLPLPSNEPHRHLRMTMRTVVVNQILGGQPADTWRTAQRLEALGLDREQILVQLGSAIGPYVEDMISRHVEWDAKTFAEALDRLPTPDASTLAGEIVEAVRAEPGVRFSRLSERLDANAQHVLEDLTHREIGWLPDDTLVHIPDVVDGRTFTLRPQIDELERSALIPAFDLAAFGRFDTVRLADGSEIDQYEPAPRMLVWLSESDWLAEYRPGELLAVTATVTGPLDATISIAAVTPEPQATEGLAATVRAIYHQLIVELGVPVTGEELALALCLHHPDLFDTPQLPLSELCAAAGLEMREGLVAHDEDVWRRGLTNQRIVEARHMVGDDEDIGPLEEALQVLDDPDAGVDEIRVALDGCAEDEFVDVLAQVLFPHGLDIADRDDTSTAHSTGHLFGLVDRAVTSARKPRERGVAEYLACVLHERCGSPDIAEAHLNRALQATPELGTVVERVGWYRFDRGDAAGASRMWSRLESPPMTSLLKRYVPGGGPTHQLGRNDPCWCGSGRKYKACHQNSTGLPGLAERFDWLVAKPAVWFQHADTEVRGVMIELAAASITGDPDVDVDDLDVDPAELPEAIDDTITDPTIMHLGLHEAGLLELFFDERGPLLPEDERRLFQTWLSIDRSVHEVVEIVGRAMLLRNTATGETVEVADIVRDAAVGDMYCAWVVPDGRGHRIVGGVIGVDADEQDEILQMCAGHDARGLCALAAPTRFDDDRY